MTQRTWLILGATSIIAEHFAHKAAQNRHSLILCGRNSEQIRRIATDLRIRYQISCDEIIIDLSDDLQPLLSRIEYEAAELDVFIAHSDFTENAALNFTGIERLIRTNILATVLIIQAYLNRNQKEHHLIFLSSVAACRGRAKNSLYGGSKACVETWLEGLQQSASRNQHLTIARLGFIDTRQTWGKPGIFYAAKPQYCANACWKAMTRHKRMIYYPSFWRSLMGIITRLPFALLKRIA